MRCPTGLTLIPALVLCLLLSGSMPTLALGSSLELGTSFTYSGRLDDAGEPAQGIFDFEFELWSARSGGELLGTLLRNARPVERGVFTEELDFGDRIHQTEQAWLEIRVRGESDSSYTSLRPRQSVTGGGSTCTVAGDAVVEGRFAAGTNAISSLADNRLHGAEATSTEGALAVTNQTSQNFTSMLRMDGNEIDSWLSGSGRAMFLNANAQANVSVGTFSSTAPLQVGRVVDAQPASGGTVVVGETDAANLAIDNNEIMARSDGAESTLFLNHNGGNVVLFGGAGGSDDLVVNGTIDLVMYELTATGCESPGSLITPQCPAGTFLVSGGCSVIGDRDLQSSSRSIFGTHWECEWTSCADPSDHSANALCLGIK